MVPMAMGFGEGGEQNAPLGRAVIGGLVLATVATLFFVPAVFSLIHNLEDIPAAEPGAGAASNTCTINGHPQQMALETKKVEDAQKETRQQHRAGWGFIALALIAAAAIGWFVYRGISQRVSAENALVHETHAESVLTVSVVHPKTSAAARQLDLPGNTQPLIDAPVYARTSGYLTKWYADIGTRVHAGQLLADIETPEVDQQLQQAKADLGTA